MRVGLSLLLTCLLLPVPMSLGNAASNPSTRIRDISQNWRLSRGLPPLVVIEQLRTTWAESVAWGRGKGGGGGG